jgi:hypothetical protein
LTPSWSITERNTRLLPIGPHPLRGYGVEVERLGDALEPETGFGLGRHGGEQEAERRLHVLAVDAAVLLVAEAAAVIDDAVEHQHRRTAAGVDPARRLDLLEVRRAEVELPERVAVAGLEPHRGRRPGEPIVVEPPERQVAVDGRALEPARGRLHEALRRLDAVPLEQLDGARGREPAPLAVLRPDLERGDELAVALQRPHGHGPRLPPVGTVRRPRATMLAELAVERGAADAVELGRRGHQPAALGIPRRQPVEPPPEVDEHLGGDPLSHPPRPGSCRAWAWRSP